MVYARKVQVVARAVLRQTFCFYDDCDEVTVEPLPAGVRVEYVSTRASFGFRDVTRLECRVESHRSQMWVDGLRVAVPLRFNGIGRQLVTAVERIALALGLPTVSAYPIAPARGFCEEIGYDSHLTTARVMTKDLA